MLKPLYILISSLWLTSVQPARSFKLLRRWWQQETSPWHWWGNRVTCQRSHRKQYVYLESLFCWLLQLFIIPAPALSYTCLLVPFQSHLCIQGYLHSTSVLLRVYVIFVSSLQASSRFHLMFPLVKFSCRHPCVFSSIYEKLL